MPCLSLPNRKHSDPSLRVTGDVRLRTTAFRTADGPSVAVCNRKAMIGVHMAGKSDRPKPPKPTKSADLLDVAEKRDRNKFARAITRSEFGRHYWDERKEVEFRASRNRKPVK